MLFGITVNLTDIEKENDECYSSCKENAEKAHNKV
jgi:hypothetical protein